jgi:hypothetical protein
MSGSAIRFEPNGFLVNTMSCLPVDVTRALPRYRRAPMASEGCGHPAPFRGAIPIGIANRGISSSSFE